MKTKYIAVAALIAAMNGSTTLSNASIKPQFTYEAGTGHILRGEVLLGIIKGFIADIKSIDESSIQPTNTLRDDLEMDSYDRLQLYSELMDLLGVVIAQDDDANLITVQDVHDFVHPQLYN